MPAALTTMSIGPDRARTSATAASTAAWSETSTGCSPCTSNDVTSTPWSRRRSTVARPMPLAPPVTMATRLTTAPPISSATRSMPAASSGPAARTCSASSTASAWASISGSRSRRQRSDHAVGSPSAKVSMRTTTLACSALRM